MTNPNRTIENPRWANSEKTQIMCEFVYPDGRRLKAAVSNTDEGNPDWYEIIDGIGADTIDGNTTKQKESVLERDKNRVEQQKLDLDRMKKEAVFNAKADAFDMDIVRDSSDKDLKSKIRKAKSILEVTVYTTILVQKELAANG